MNKEDLEIAKRIAEIECLKYKQGELCIFIEVSGLVGTVLDKYNPFDWSVLGLLMVKYEVEVAYWLSSVTIEVSGIGNISVDFNSKKDIPRAILECIIKSKEL